MRISKFLPIICAMGVAASFISVRAQDNPAQAASRAAVMEKMNEMSEPTNTAPLVGITPSSVEAQQSLTPANSQPAPAMAPLSENTAAYPPESSDNPAQAAARAALMEKMSEAAPIQTEPMSPAATNITVAPMPPQAESAMRKNEKAQKEATAVERKRAEAEKEATKAAEKSPAMSKPSANPANNPGASLGFTPMKAPPLPISANKEAQLQALDAKYKANEIEPADYFKQREAILAEPNGTNQ